jgi:maltose O-acetyltransferase
MKRQLLNLSMSFMLGVRLRRAVLNTLGLSLAPDAKVSRGTRLGGTNITIGNGSGAHEECWIDDYVTILDNVRLGPRVTIITQSHPVGGPDQRRGWEDVTKPVTIGRGSWVQAGVTILPGANIAPGCVIYAGAVVTKPTEPNGVYAGVPAQRIGDLTLTRGRGVAPGCKKGLHRTLCMV